MQGNYARDKPFFGNYYFEEWGELHQQELLEMWNTKDFHKVQPLV
jgi:hypothetical protein